MQSASEPQHNVPIEEYASVDDLEINAGIVVSNYYSQIAERLLTGCLDVLKPRPTVSYEVFRVMGTWEVPVVAKSLVETNRIGGIIALGCVIRGDTSHYDYICQETSRALMNIAMEFTIPVGFGILTVDTFEQALDRSGLGKKKTESNKGAEAALAVIQSAYSIAGIRQES